MEIVIKGIAYGILLAFLIGPVFFTIIQTSIERGFMNGAYVAVGVSISDAFYITVTYLGISQIVNNPNLNMYLGYGGGSVLLVFGLYYLFIKSKKLQQYNHQEVLAKSPLRCMVKGFVINGLSPMVLLFWVATMGVATSEFGYVTPSSAVLFFGSIVITVFTTDLIKAKLADKLRKVMTPRVIRILNVVLGLAMIIFGSKLIFFAGSASANPAVHLL